MKTGTRESENALPVPECPVLEGAIRPAADPLRHRNGLGLENGGRGRISFAVSLFLACLGSALLCFFLVRAAGTGHRSLPPIPDLTGYNSSLKHALEEAYRKRGGKPHPGKIGMVYHANQFTEEAEQCYLLAMKRYPEEARWPYLLAALRQSLGIDFQVIALLNRSLERAEGYAPGLQRIGDALFKKGKPEKAREFYDRCLALSPDDPYAHLGLARIAVRENLWDVARKHLEKGVKAFPYLGTAYRLLARAYRALGETEKAVLAEYRASGCPRFRPAPDPWVDDLMEHCFLADSLLVTADLARQTGDAEGEIRLIRRVCEIVPHRGMPRARLANALRRAGREEEAETHLRIAVQEDPECEEAHYELGLLLGKKGLYEEAEKQHRKALEINPQSFNAIYGLGYIEMKLNRYARAAEKFRRAAEIAEYRHADAVKDWIKCLLAEGKRNQAIRSLEEVLAKRPSWAPIRARLCDLYAEDGRWKDAARALREGLEDCPYEGLLANNLAMLLSTSPLATEKTAEEALHLARIACQYLDPNNYPLALDTLAAAYAHAGRFADAVETVNRAIRLAREAGLEHWLPVLSRHLDLFLAEKTYSYSE